METTVIGIEWNPDSDGDLIPVICIIPIYFYGCWIGKIPGFNEYFIRTRGIGPGVIMKIGRTNSNLPYIMEIINPISCLVSKKIDNLNVF